MKRNDGTEKPTLADQKKREGEKALAERRAESDAVNKNMARLRALRLERETANKEK